MWCHWRSIKRAYSGIERWHIWNVEREVLGDVWDFVTILSRCLVVGRAFSHLRRSFKWVKFLIKIFDTWLKEIDICLRNLLYLVCILHFGYSCEHLCEEVISFWLLLFQHHILLLWTQNFRKFLWNNLYIFSFYLKFVCFSGSLIVVEQAIQFYSLVLFTF